jgi:hypothetical protein
MSESTVARMQLNMSESSLDVFETNLDSLSAQTERSHVSISSTVKVLQGSINDGTFLYVGDIDDIQLKKDNTSRLVITQQ